MSVSTPDFAGFIAAQDRLRQLAGSPTLMEIPNEPQWPVNTRINPDTNMPYDAMIKRTNAEFTTVEITALIILKQGSPLRPQADTHWEEIGLLSGMDIIMDVGAYDYDTVSRAGQFMVNTLTYELMELKPFSVAGILYRWLMYGQEH